MVRQQNDMNTRQNQVQHPYDRSQTSGDIYAQKMSGNNPMAYISSAHLQANLQKQFIDNGNGNQPQTEQLIGGIPANKLNPY
jgi:hypothetical protein